mmetsp:Transcript_45164/g.145577  ORF Transcript_45164/g.145577 Transcript_45164/m.145577 type:complete len:329 (+) Transcript_45164:363-1349(+)
MRHAQLAPARVAHAIVAIVAELDVLDLLHLIGRVPDPVGQRVSAVLAHALKAAALLVALLEPSHDLCHVLVHVLLLLVVVIVITHQRVVLRLRAGDAVRVLELYARRLLVVGELDLVPRREEGVESEDELAVPVEELQHAVDDAGRVDRLRLELLHDVEELVVDMRLLLELHLDLVEVREGVLDLELPVRRGRRRCRVCRRRRPTHPRRPSQRKAAGERALLWCHDGLLRHHRARRAAGRAGRAGRCGDRRARPTRSASRRHRLLRHQGRRRGLQRRRRRLYRCRRQRRRELGSHEPGRRDRRYDGCRRRWRGHHTGRCGRRDASWRC